MSGKKGWSFLKLLILVNVPVLLFFLDAWQNPPPRWRQGQVVPVRNGAIHVLSVDPAPGFQFAPDKRWVYIWAERTAGQCPRTESGGALELEQRIACRQ